MSGVCTTLRPGCVLSGVRLTRGYQAETPACRPAPATMGLFNLPRKAYPFRRAAAAAAFTSHDTEAADATHRTAPAGPEDGAALAKRRAKAATRKRCGGRCTPKFIVLRCRPRVIHGRLRAISNNLLYDSTLQETTIMAANTLCALLFPGWSKGKTLAFGGDVDKKKVTPEILARLSAATDTFFDFLNHSNFPQVINETALDLMVGTGALCFDEGDNENPFVFSSIPLSALEIEEGPNGKVETTFMVRKPMLRNLIRMYEGLSVFDLRRIWRRR